MSNVVDFKLTGFAGVADRLKLLSSDVATKVGQAANRAGAVFLLARAKAAAPVGPDAEGSKRTRHNKNGTTRIETHHKIINSMKVVKVRTYGVNAVSNAVTVSSKAYQASFVELGSIRNAANPFMRRALAANRDEIIAKMGQVIERRLKKLGV